MKFCFLLTACCLFSISFKSVAQAQHIKSGRTIDSHTFEPIPLVYVQSLLTKSVVITNEKGEFQISCTIGDSLIVSGLAYHSKKLLVGTSNEPLLITLSEVQIILPAISIYGDFKPQGKEQWSDAIRTPKPYDNPTYKPGNDYTMQTFGAGYTIVGPISYFLKSEREKRKLNRDKEEDSKTKIYRMVVSDPETKATIMNHFSISEEKYNSKMEQFALEYREAVYSKSKTDLIDLLYYLFSKK